MTKRLITAFLGAIVFFLILPSPKEVFAAAVLVVILLSVYEIHNAITKNKVLIFVGFAVAATIFFTTIYYKMLFGIIVGFAVYLILSIVLYGREIVSKIYMLGFATIAYSLSFATLSLIKTEYTAYAAIIPFIFAWITDSGAYFAGKAIGRHKLIPKLSPKKTVEGAIGGVVCCVLCSALYMHILEKCFGFYLIDGNACIKILPIAFFASIISQLGDFASSALKREFNVKDFGKILPGHGGMMDRLDSIVFVAPFVYYFLTILSQI